MAPSPRALGSRVAARSAMPAQVWILAINAFFVSLGFGVMMPVLPVFAKQFGVDNFHIAWVISTFALMRLVTSPFSPKINRAFGERWVLGVGMFLVAASSIAAGMARSFWELLILRGIGGIGSAMFTVAAMTLLIRSVSASIRGRASGFYQGGFLIGGMAGPAVGGLMSSISIRAPFFFYGATLIVGGVMCLLLIHPKPRGAPGKPIAKKSDDATLPEAFADVRYQAAIATGFAQGWQSFGVRNSLVPLIITGALAMPTQWTGYVFAVSAVAQAITLFPSGRWTDTIGRRPIMIAGSLITGIVAILTPFAPNVWWMMLFFGLYGIGSAFHSTAPTAAVGDATRGRGGAPVAFFSMSSDIGVIVGPLAAGWLADHMSMSIAFGVGGIMLLSAALYSFFMPKERPPQMTYDQRRMSEELASEGLD